MILVINKYLVEAVLSGKKCAVMTQGKFRIGEQIQFEYHPGNTNDTLFFATGKIYAAAGLKVDPIKNTIHKRGMFSWILCTRETVKKIIASEGIAHEDDFWKSHSEPYEVFQIYFDQVQTIK